MFSTLLSGIIYLFSGDSPGFTPRRLQTSSTLTTTSFPLGGIPLPTTSSLPLATIPPVVDWAAMFGSTTMSPFPYYPSLYNTTNTESPYDTAMHGDYLGALLLAGMAYIIGATIISICIHIGYLVFACMYKSKVTDKRPPFRGGNILKGSPDFLQPTFGCFDNCSTCMHGYFCTACRWGDTYNAAGIMGYWSLILTLFGTCLCSSVLTQGLSYALLNHEAATPEELNQNAQTSSMLNMIPIIVDLCLCAFFATKRGEIKEQLGGTKNFLKDFVCLCCCLCCSIIQEARAVDEATGVDVHCCCIIEKVGENMVGEPMLVSESEPEFY